MFNDMKKIYVDSTPKKTKTVEGMLFDYATEKELVTQNPIKQLRKLPKSEKSLNSDSEISRVYNDEQLEHILKIAKNDLIIDGMIYLLAYTGMRPGELRALKLNDIDLENCTLYIRRAASIEKLWDKEGNKTGQEEYISDVKNGNYGHRKINVPRFVLEMALAQHNRMLEDPKYKKAKDTQYLFPSMDGSFIRERAFYSRWKRFRERNNFNCNEYSPYYFRHTVCTNLIRRNVPVSTVQRILGENTPELVMKVYTHINNNDMTNAMKMLQTDVMNFGN